MTLLAQVEQACRNHNLVFRRVGEGDRVARDDAAGTQVMVFAQMGRMLQLYSVSDIAIVGGTYRDFGGHNPLEPASQSAVTVVGPYIQNIDDDIAYLHSRRCAFIARERKLPELLRRLADDPQRRQTVGEGAARAVQERRGIASRCVDMMAERGMLPESCK
jgi:3-deoxy-D-manno-octulosonic-acid transferase